MNGNDMMDKALRAEIECMTFDIENRLGDMDLNLLVELLRERNARIRLLVEREPAGDLLVGFLDSIMSRDAVIRARIDQRYQALKGRLDTGNREREAHRRYRRLEKTL